MLDFYLIADHQVCSDNPEGAGLTVAGHIGPDAFGRLKKIKVIDERFEYGTDFRWSREVIVQMRSTIMKRQLQSSTDVQKLMSLLNFAEQNNSGLIAYAD